MFTISQSPWRVDANSDSPRCSVQAACSAVERKAVDASVISTPMAPQTDPVAGRNGREGVHRQLNEGLFHGVWAGGCRRSGHGAIVAPVAVEGLIACSVRSFRSDRALSEGQHVRSGLEMSMGQHGGAGKSRCGKEKKTDCGEGVAVTSHNWI